MLVGWDISTSAIGICVKDDDGTTVEFGVIYPKGESHAEKHRSAASQVVNFCKRVCPQATHYVEERLGGFTGGLTTKQTLMALAAMNAVVSFILSDFGTVTHLAPVTVKSIMQLKVPKDGDKKAIVVGLVRAKEPTFPYAETPAGNWVKGTDDMADAWLLVEAGGKISRGEVKIGPKTKAAGGKRKTGPTAGRRKSKGRVGLPVPKSKV